MSDHKPTVKDLTIKFKPTLAMVAAYSKAITGFVAGLADIPDERKGELHELLWKTVMVGYDRAACTTGLVEGFGLEVNRAAEISSHQHSLARMTMDIARRLELGLTEAIWMFSGIPCEGQADHERLNGRRFNIKTGVLMGGKWIWPGSEPGCRCCDKTDIPGFD